MDFYTLRIQENQHLGELCSKIKYAQINNILTIFVDI